MKHSFLIVSFLYIGFAYISCSKNKNETVQKITPKLNITGEWKWIESLGGWGSIDRPAADSIVKLTLTADSSYIVTLNNELKYSGHYSTIIIPELDSLPVLQFHNPFSIQGLRFHDSESLIYFKNDSCRFYDYQIADGSSHLFTRE